MKKSCQLQDFTIYKPFFFFWLGDKEFPPAIGMMCECSYWHMHVLMRDCRKEKCSKWEATINKKDREQ